MLYGPPHAVTTDRNYTERLESNGRTRWKRLLNVQAPYRWNVRRLGLGRVLDVGCGIGRNLEHLGGHGVGVDNNRTSVEAARKRGLTVYTSVEFPASRDATIGGYDSLLLAHVLEHQLPEEAPALVERYLPYVRPGGRVVVIVPQEAGYASDPTHSTFLEADDVSALMTRVNVEVERSFSFPFPRAIGRVFTHNETVVIGARRQSPPRAGKNRR